MKTTLLFIVVLFSSQLFCQTAVINGIVVDKYTGNPYPYEHVQLAEKSTITDLDGRFSFDSVAKGNHLILVEDYGRNELSEDVVYSVYTSSEDTVNIVIKAVFDCIYDKHKDNKRCPICKKKNEVIPIVYGLYIGEIPIKKGKPQVYLGSCEITGCDPNWYCRRDEHKF